MVERNDPENMGLGEIVKEIISIAEAEFFLKASEYVPNMVHIPILHQGHEERIKRENQLYEELDRRENKYLPNHEADNHSHKNLPHYNFGS